MTTWHKCRAASSPDCKAFSMRLSTKFSLSAHALQDQEIISKVFSNFAKYFCKKSFTFKAKAPMITPTATIMKNCKLSSMICTIFKTWGQ